MFDGLVHANKNDLYSQESVRAALMHIECIKVLTGCVEKAKVLIYLPTECTAKTLISLGICLG